MLLPFSMRARSWEPKALDLRRLAGIDIADPLDPWQLAPKVGLTVVDGQRVMNTLDGEWRAHLLGAGRHSWSGGVYPRALSDGTYLCILNPTHSRRRNKITLMEEIVHTYLNHKPSVLVPVTDGLGVRCYDKAHEEEGYGVGAAALLPWQTFFAAVNAGHTIQDLAEYYDVTPHLVKYRIKITGAFRLFQSRQRGRA